MGMFCLRDDEGDINVTKWALLEEDCLQKLAVLGMKASLQDLHSSCMPLSCFFKEGLLTSLRYSVS